MSGCTLPNCVTVVDMYVNKMSLDTKMGLQGAHAFVG